jgi:hypothetical protein
MRRYLKISVDENGPTVDKVIEALQEISNQGMGQDTVFVYYPQTEDWEFLEEIGYDGDKQVMLFGDSKLAD